MRKQLLVASLVASFAWAGSVQAQVVNVNYGEPGLRQDLEVALWPADIVRLANAYLRQYPRGQWADQAQSLRDRAAGSMQVLSRNDVRLYRNAFQPRSDSASVQDDMRRAALGDKDAAARVAHVHLHSDSAPVGENSRYLGWLQFAAVLGNERASYELALHYRQQGQVLLASQYEARAVALGFVPPTSLDHVRK